MCDAILQIKQNVAEMKAIILHSLIVLCCWVRPPPYQLSLHSWCDFQSDRMMIFFFVLFVVDYLLTYIFRPHRPCAEGFYDLLH